MQRNKYKKHCLYHLPSQCSGTRNLTLYSRTKGSAELGSQWEQLTFKLQSLHCDLFDVCSSTHVKLPDFGVNAQVTNMKHQERECLLLS